MDRFFLYKIAHNEIISKEEMHCLGLASILLSSKLEDVKPIHMNQILEDAGHKKFTKEQILD